MKPKTLEEWRMLDVVGRSRGGREYFTRLLTSQQKALLSAQGEDVFRAQGALIVLTGIVEAMDRAPREVESHERRDQHGA